MHFTKMQGLGNDYLYVFGEVPGNIAELSQKLSDRHFGAGSDGMIYISPSELADFRMRIFNADGSEAKMCGNGIRCVGKYVYDKGYTDKSRITVETLSGIKTLLLETANGKVRSVTVDMGSVIVGKDEEIVILGQKVKYVPVNVGNPHIVIFTDDVENAPLTTLGAALEKADRFSGGTNVEFVQKVGEGRIRMRVWERGSGITMACGTGACASAAAAVSRGLCKFSEPVAVDLDGGTLKITIEPDMSTRMTGPAATVYEADVAM
ncbi:MAG: diaminopimelate epimerase [Lachnospiraceae bacterium]|nr:diaminopimelate epimerase [Lachnospiraceae bacterium]